LAEQVGGLAYEVGAGIQERRGLEAGLKAGQQAAEKGEIIETQKGFLSQISIFDQAYNNALTKAYVAGVDNDARESINRLLTDNPDDIESFDEAVNAYRAGVTQNIAEEFRPLIDQSMDQMISSARSQVHQAQTAKNLKNADDTLIRSTETAVNYALKAERLGDSEAGLIHRMNAFSSIDARVEAGTITKAAGETLKQNIISATEAEKARGGLQAIIKAKGAISAVDFINKVADPSRPLSYYTIEQQEELADVLRADLNEYIALTNIQETQAEEALKARQGENFTSLYVGIINGETDMGDITRTAMSGGLSKEDLRSLTNVMNTRGQGIDNYEFIYGVQTQMYENPEYARKLLIDNTGGLVTSKTALDLLNALDQEPILNTATAKRYRTFLKNNVATTDLLGNITGENKERATFLMFEFDNRVLAGEAPEAVALDLVSVDDILRKNFDREFEKLEQELADGLSDSEYNERFQLLTTQQQRMENFENMMADIKRGQ